MTKRKREKMSMRGFTLLAVHTDTAMDFRAAACAAGVTQDALMRSLLSTLSEVDADAVQLDLFDSRDVVVEDAEDTQDVE